MAEPSLPVPPGKRRIHMRTFILIAGTAMVLTATPALAGGPGGGGLVGGVTGAVGNILGGGAPNGVGGLAGSLGGGGLGGCLCNTVNGVVGHAAGMVGNAGNPGSLVNSVVGLGSLG